jgi:hypothetical protein
VAFLATKLGANDYRLEATLGHVQPSSLRPNSMSGHTQHHPGTFRKCLLSSSSSIILTKFLGQETCANMAS